MKKTVEGTVNGKVPLWSKRTFWCLLFVIASSWLTYFQNYEYPNRFFWDEGYNVGSAQKYLNDTFYIGFHPPLGRMLMAFGQHMTEPDAKNDHFLNAYRAGYFPDEMNIKGYRTIPVLLGWLTAPLLFFVFLLLLRSPIQSMMLSFLFIFDNALIVHLRGAMLEGALLFFVTTALILFILLVQKKDTKKLFYFLSVCFGAVVAFAITVKVLACILVLLVPAILFQLYPDRKKSLQFLLIIFTSFFVVYLAVWQIHASLTSELYRDENGNAKYYTATEQYREILNAGEGASPAGVLMAMQHSVKKVAFQKSAPALDLCKVAENGSPPILWPLGSHSILYGSEYEEAVGMSRYLYLQINPVVWSIGLLGVLFSFAYVTSALLFWQGRATSRLYYMSVLLVVYVSYMLAVSSIDRVMYLYHYFIPLLLSFILFGLSFDEIRSLGPWKLTQNMRDITLSILALCVFLSFQFYRPLTYFEPISNESVERRALFPLWELRCRGCERERIWANPTTPSQK